MTLLGSDGQPVAPELEAIARQLHAMRGTVIATLAQIDAVLAALGLPVAAQGGLGGLTSGEAKPAPAKSEGPVDPRARRSAFNRPRIVADDESTSPREAPAGTVQDIRELFDRSAPPCQRDIAGAPTAGTLPMAPELAAPATGTGAGDGGRSTPDPAA